MENKERLIYGIGVFKERNQKQCWNVLQQLLLYF